MRTNQCVIYNMGGSANSIDAALNQIEESFPGQLRVTMGTRNDLLDDAMLESFLETVRQADLVMILTYGGTAGIPLSGTGFIFLRNMAMSPIWNDPKISRAHAGFICRAKACMNRPRP